MQGQAAQESTSKSKRVMVRNVDNRTVDILVKDEDEEKKPPKPDHCGGGEALFMLAQIITVVLIGCFTTYESTDDGDTLGSATLPDYEDNVSKEGFSPAKDYVQRLYPVFQDVHVMIFIGFGFLMTFIKTSSWSALAFNWIISAWALQWGILSTGFWHQVTHKSEDGSGLHKIRIDIAHLIAGDFAAGAAMITFGAVLGKINLQQMFFLVWWEMIWYGLNEAICVNVFHVTDAGGSILVHTFGAYFGVACTFGFQPKRAGDSINMQSNYQSEMIAVVGSIFLWMFWPSFNGGLAEGTTQHRIICNTTLGIVGSVISACSTARILFGKLDMEIVLNATLAGGVAIGSSCDLICEPWCAIMVGMLGGILSALGFSKIGPWIMDSKLALQDTCGVHSLHGMPGVLAALISMFYLITLEGKNFPADYFYYTDPSNFKENPGTANEKAGVPGTYSDQAIAQLKSLLVTLCISIVSGLSGGFLCSLDCWKPVHALFRDDDHFHHVLQKYPQHYLEVSDEAVEYAKMALLEMQALLIAAVPEDCSTKEERIEWIGENIYDKIAKHDQEMNKAEVLGFLNEYLISQKDAFEDDDYHAEKLLPGNVFNKIFAMLDMSKNGKVSRDEICDYFQRLTEGTKCEGPPRGRAGGDLEMKNMRNTNIQ